MVAVALILLVQQLPGLVFAAAPSVHELWDAGIDIDGSSKDWDTSKDDFLADLREGSSSKGAVRASLYGRYECGTETMFVRVKTVDDWLIVPSDKDNYAGIGDSKRVDGGSIGSNLRHFGTSAPPAGRHHSRSGPGTCPDGPCRGRSGCAE